MHYSEIIELAALLTSRASVIVHEIPTMSEACLHEYWSTSKCRQDHWVRQLRAFQDASQEINATNEESPECQAVRWAEFRPVLEEILAAEVLTRVWLAILTGHDQHRGVSESEPVARSVYIGHLEVRLRALNLMIRGAGVGVEQAVKLNHLRRRIERWTDLLLAELAVHVDVSSWAFDVDRTRDFAEDLRFDRRRDRDHLVWQIMLSSLRTAFRQGFSSSCPNAEMDRRVSESILMSLPSQLFDSTGVLKSLWMLRLDHITADAEGMINEYLTVEALPGLEYTQRQVAGSQKPSRF